MRISRVISIAILSVLVIFLAYLFTTAYLKGKELEGYKGFTAGKFYHCKQYPKTSNSYYKYYVNGVLYRSKSGPPCPENADSLIGKFFTVEYSTKNPEVSRLDFGRVVTDTIFLKREGFAKKEILESM